MNDDRQGAIEPMPADRAAATANGQLCEAIEAVAQTARTLAIAAGSLIEAIDEGRTEAGADALTIGAAAAQQLAQAADLWVGLAVGLAETRQRVLAGADRTIDVRSTR